VTRYRDICTELAGQVVSGDLTPGTELAGVRDLALRFDTTASTISRAERALAEAGVIVVTERRRARIAPGARLAARRFLHGETVLRLAGSDDPALDIVVRTLGRAIQPVGAEGSSAGLRAVRQGRADAAAVHLLHHTGEYNGPFARGLLRGMGPHSIHLWRREQGLLTPPGNPEGLRSVTDLLGCRVAKRHTGTGTRTLLDRLIRDSGADPDALRGPEVGSHLEAALAVASGVVDAAVGVRSAARDLELHFVPLTWEDYDVVLGVDALDAAAPLVGALHSPQVRAAVEALRGYDTTHSGRVRELGP
jgi:molybdate-binding protein